MAGLRSLDDDTPAVGRLPELLLCVSLLIERDHFHLRDIDTFALRAGTVTRFFHRPDPRRNSLEAKKMYLFGRACSAWPETFLPHRVIKGCLYLMRS